MAIAEGDATSASTEGAHCDLWCACQLLSKNSWSILGNVLLFIVSSAFGVCMSDDCCYLKIVLRGFRMQLKMMGFVDFDINLWWKICPPPGED